MRVFSKKYTIKKIRLSKIGIQIMRMTYWRRCQLMSHIFSIKWKCRDKKKLSGTENSACTLKFIKIYTKLSNKFSIVKRASDKWAKKLDRKCRATWEWSNLFPLLISYRMHLHKWAFICNWIYHKLLLLVVKVLVKVPFWKISLESK